MEARNLLLHHLGVRDHATGAPIREERFFQIKRGGVFAVKEAAEFLEGSANFSAPFQPGAVNAITRAINIAPPDAFEAQQNIALVARHFFQFIGKRDRRRGFKAHDRAETPFCGGPITRRKEHYAAAGRRHSGPQPFQIGLGAAGRIAAPDESYGKFGGRRHGTLLGWERHNTC